MENVKYEIQVKKINYRENYMGKSNVIESVIMLINFTSTIDPEISLEKKYILKCDMESFDREKFTDYGEINLDTIISWLLASDPFASKIEEVEVIKNGIEYINNKLAYVNVKKEDRPDWVYTN